MRKNEIKTGVVYAYQQGRDAHPRPIVFLSAQDLLKITLSDFEQATSNYATGVDGTRFDVVTSLAAVTGPYEEKLAEYKAQQDVERRQREQAKAVRRATLDRAAGIRARLIGYGVEATMEHGRLKISLDDAEKLLVALNATQR